MTLRTMLAAGLVALACTAVARADEPKPGTAMKGMAKHGAAASTSPATQAYEKAMAGMHASTMAMKPTGDADKDFVMMMKPHHQAAVEMAEAYLKYGHDPALTAMAHAIVDSQTKEIGEMNAWAAAHGMAAK